MVDYVDNGQKKHIETISTEKQQKFLCVNGTMVGEQLTEAAANKLGYIRYNRAYGSYYRATKSKSAPPCVVLVKF